MLCIIIIGILLNRNIGQVNEQIVQIIGRLIVPNRAKATKTHFVHVRLQWSKRRHQDVNAQVKLLAANEQRVANVTADYVRVLGRWRRDGALCAPFFQLACLGS